MGGSLIVTRRRRARLAQMLFEDALNHLPEGPETPRDKLLAALEMYDEGVAMQRLSLQRGYPDLGALELDNKLDRWLAREDELP
jgi:hypothetical protein